MLLLLLLLLWFIIVIIIIIINIIDIIIIIIYYFDFFHLFVSVILPICLHSRAMNDIIETLPICLDILLEKISNKSTIIIPLTLTNPVVTAALVPSAPGQL